jgi:tetratricopeptide (TPR) repeat protein
MTLDNPSTQSNATALSTLEQAIGHHQAGRLGEAEQVYRAILRENPGHPDANHNLGILAGQVGRPDAGLPFFLNAVNAAPGREQYALSYSNALLALGDAKEAAGFLESAIERGLNTAALRCNLGNAARTLGQADLAMANFQAALAIDPGHALAHYNLATLLQDMGDFTGAENEYRLALASSPNFAEAHNNLGICLQQLQRLDDAIACFRHAIDANPGYADGHFNLGNALNLAGQREDAPASCGRGLDIGNGDAFEKAAETDPKAGLLKESEQSLRRALALQPANAAFHNNLGNTLRALDHADEALTCYRQALALQPEFPEALVNLAAMLGKRGDFQAAAEASRHAVLLRPGMAEAHINLAEALEGLGAWDDAIGQWQAALNLQRELPDVHYNMGNLLRKLERLDEAEHHYRQALASNPRFYQACNNLGIVLHDLGRFAEAEACYREALRLQPNFAACHSNLAATLQLRDRAEAEESCRRALALDPGLAEAMVVLADLLSHRGEFADAEALLREAIAIEPDLHAAWAGIPSLRKMTEADLPWFVRAEQLVQQAMPARTAVYLRHAMGKYQDDVKNFDMAFLNHQAANELSKLYAVPYDAAAEEREADAIIDRYDAQFVNRQRSDASASTRPVFIVGMPRSGTSLAEQIIAAHPAAFGAGELSFWETVRHESDAQQRDQLEQELPHHATRYLATLDGHSITAERVVDKMPTNFHALGLIHAAFPNARIIHMERNPIDTCLSIYFQNFDASYTYANDLSHLAHQYQCYRRLMEHWRSVIPQDRLLHVPYERLVGDQEYWTRTILEFLDLPWSPLCMDYHLKNRTVGTASNWQVRQKMHGASVERWRHYEKFVGPLLHLAA